jgi:cytochrome c553
MLKIFALLPLVVIVTVDITGAIAGPYDGQEIAEGEKIAVKMCSPCHALPAASDPASATPSIAASMSEIAKGNKAAHESLVVLLRSTHSNAAHPGNMPNLELSEADIWKIAAYFSTFRGEDRRE